jgi:hypothetical protein
MKVGEEKGTKERERVVGKAAGDECVFIPGEGPDAAGGEGGHGAAKPDGVIHRYHIYQEKYYSSTLFACSLTSHDLMKIIPGLIALHVIPSSVCPMDAVIRRWTTTLRISV